MPTESGSQNKYEILLVLSYRNEVHWGQLELIWECCESAHFSDQDELSKRLMEAI